MHHVLSHWQASASAFLQSGIAYCKKHFSKGLLIAVLVSVLLHGFMLYEAILYQAFGLTPIDLASTPEDVSQITATLSIPVPTAAVVPSLKNPSKEPPTPAKTSPPTQTADNPTEGVTQAHAISDAVYTPTDAPLPTLNPVPINHLNDGGTDAQATETVEPEVAEAQAINPSAYPYAETYFDVRTDMSASAQASPAGNAKMIFQLTNNNTQYQIDSLTAPKGLAALFIANLTQKSVGNFTTQGLQPTQYDYQFGDKPDKTYRARFDWDKANLYLTTKKGEQVVKLDVGAQDLLSFMYQFMYVPPLNNLQFSITNGKKLALYTYLFEGEELVDTKMGALKTVHIARENDDHDEKTDLWLAVDYQYLPVKIRKTEKNGKVYELLATKILTKAP